MPAKQRPNGFFRKRRKRFLDEWIRRNGNICPGYGSRFPHYSDELSVDHVKPLSRGGPEWGQLQILCKECNSMKYMTDQTSSSYVELPHANTRPPKGHANPLNNV